LTQLIAVKLIKKFWGGKEVEAVLHRLDRLTQDEARTTAAQTLEVVYGLVQNMKFVMDGEATLSGLSLVVDRHHHHPTLQTAGHRQTVSKRL
jgi:hypothetical protein